MRKKSTNLNVALSIGTLVRKVDNIRSRPPRTNTQKTEQSVVHGPSNASPFVPPTQVQLTNFYGKEFGVVIVSL